MSMIWTGFELAWGLVLGALSIIAAYGLLMAIGYLAMHALFNIKTVLAVVILVCIIRLLTL